MEVSIDVDLDVTGVDSLCFDVFEQLRYIVDLYVLDFLLVDMAEDLHVSLILDLSLCVVDLARELPYVANMGFVFKDIIVGGCDQLHRLLVKNYVQFVPMSECVEIHMILVFEWLQQGWLMCRFFLVSGMD